MRCDECPPNAALHYDFTRDPSCQKALDLSGINKPFDNLLINSQFEDADKNGIPDYWPVYNPAGIVANYLLDGDTIKIELIESTTTVTGAQLSQNITNSAPGQIFSCRCIAKVSSPDIRAQLQISYYTEAGYGGVVGNTVSTTDATDTLLSVENAVVPPDAIRIQILLRLIPNTSGAVGIGWFKSPELIRHLSLDRPDKSTYIYGAKWTPEGLSFDGVDDYCQVENNADADITVATSERPLTIAIVARPKGNAQAYLLGKNNDANTNQYSVLYSGSGKIQFRTNDLGSVFSPGISANQDEIVYYVISYDGANLKEYKNGTLISTLAKSGNLTSRPHIHLGCRKSAASREYYYQGTISELYVGHAQPDEIISWFERTGRFEKYGIAR